MGLCEFNKLTLLPCRNIEKIPLGARAVITLAFPYLLPGEMYEGLTVSRYAAVKDYHLVVPSYLEKIAGELKELFPKEEFAFFSDNSPIPEVTAAVLSGIGVRGRNGLLITKKYGSYVFLGEIVTTAPAESVRAELEKRNIEICSGEINQTQENPVAANSLGINTAKENAGEISRGKIDSEEISHSKISHSKINIGCLDCGECISACPAGCIDENGVDSARCFSFLNQKKGELSEKTVALIKSTGCVWGCDICQKVCPMNKNAHFTEIPEFMTSIINAPYEGMDLSDRAYSFRGRKTIERNIRALNECENPL